MHAPVVSEYCETDSFVLDVAVPLTSYLCHSVVRLNSAGPSAFQPAPGARSSTTPSAAAFAWTDRLYRVPLISDEGYGPPENPPPAVGAISRSECAPSTEVRLSDMKEAPLS